MMSMLEHLSITAQVFFAFAYSNIAWGIIALIIWILFLVIQFLYWKDFKLEVIDKDITYRKWLSAKNNKWTSYIIGFLGTFISWRFYKLLYSHYFGYQIKTTDFSDSKKFQLIMWKYTKITMVAIYAPLIFLNFICLFTISWGNQLYIQVIENILVSIVMICCTIIEHKLMLGNQHSDRIRRAKKTEQMKFLSHLHEEQDMSQATLLGKVSKRNVFVAMTIEELIQEFGNRTCKSMGDYQKSPMEEDPRKIHTYPHTPNLKIHVDDPPKPLGPILVDNCYHEPKPKEELNELKPLDGRGRNKAVQVGGPFDNDLLRSDADVITMSVQAPTVSGINKNKKARGRKNRYFEQIDKEDHNAGAILDSDDEGETANRKARNDHLQAIREEDEQQKQQPVLKEEVKAVLDQKVQEQKVQAQLEALKAEDELRKAKFKAKIEAEEKLLRESVSKKSMPEAVTPNSTSKAATAEQPASVKSTIKKVDVVKAPLLQPDMKTRWFNEIDVIGDCERGPKGVPMVKETSEGTFMDQSQRRVTKQGYLLDPTGNVITSAGSQILFREFEEDLPAPFCVERFNFNPFELNGYHASYYDTRDSCTFAHQKDNERMVDGKNRPINFQGFLHNEEGSLIQPNGKVVFHVSQLNDGQLPALYCYTGKTFTVHEVMGCFPKLDGTVPNLKKDAAGRLVNERGYLVTREGHICNRAGKVLFPKDTLKGGEFPKFFHFTKFPKHRFFGELSTETQGNQVPNKGRDGKYTDQKGKSTNQKGFLIDGKGNLVDLDGNLMFEKHLLTKDGDLPELFRQQVNAHADSNDELDSLMKKINKQMSSAAEDDAAADHPREKTPVRQSEQKLPDDGESPVIRQEVLNQNEEDLRASQYNQAQGIEEETSVVSTSAKGHKAKAKKKKGKMVKVKQYFEQDIKMADAYGGVAQPRVRMVPKRFASVARQRADVGANNSPNNRASMKAAELQAMADSGQDLHQMPSTATAGKRGDIPVGTSLNGSVTNAHSHTNHGLESVVQQSEPNEVQGKRHVRDSAKKREAGNNGAATQAPGTASGQGYDQEFEAEFEKLYKKDIDKFIDGSNFEVESLSGFSELSGGNFNIEGDPSKTKELEAEYMRKLEKQKAKHQQLKTKGKARTDNQSRGHGEGQGRKQ